MNKIFILCVIASLFGGITGYFTPIVIPTEYNKLFSVAILAGIETVFNGIKMLVKDRFDSRLFIYNFFVNVCIAVTFVFVGDNLGLNLYYVVLLALGFRLLQDLDVIKLYIFNK